MVEEHNPESSILQRGNLVEIPGHHDILWYDDPDIPWIRIFNPLKNNDKFERISLGPARKWLENNINNNVYYEFRSQKHPSTGFPGYELTIFFDSADDYIAFKLVFPELCRQDV